MTLGLIRKGKRMCKRPVFVTSYSNVEIINTASLWLSTVFVKNLRSWKNLALSIETLLHDRQKL